ncbi:MAG: hypothetical protein HQ591_06390 [candidate division Zixibacteria bacterium]|nr:hypothetical protein [Candidatus Tariuqbacter arcticus]
MISRIRKYIILAAIVSLFFIWGCEHSSDDIPTGIPTDVPDLIESGWENFTNSDYEQAIIDFSEASSRNALAIEAYLGLGWSLMRDCQYNPAISNIYNVSSLINLGVVTDPDEIDRYNSESSACLVGAYQGLYPDDIGYYAPMVVENVNATLTIDSNFVFTYDLDVNRQALLVAKADAYYALSQFVNSYYAICEVADSVLLDLQFTEDDPIIVQTLFDSTTVLGYGRLTVPGVQLLDVTKVTDDASPDPIEYTVEGFEQAGTDITFFGVPIPQTGDIFLTTYYHTADYVVFLSELRALIDSYR